MRPDAMGWCRKTSIILDGSQFRAGQADLAIVNRKPRGRLFCAPQPRTGDLPKHIRAIISVGW